jgi:outer membrane protein assembly factor BamB
MLYVLDAINLHVLSTIQVEKPIFATAVSDVCAASVYVTGLSGFLYSFSLKAPFQLNWKIDFTKPLFSSPTLIQTESNSNSPQAIIVASTDGMLRCCNHLGAVLWSVVCSTFSLYSTPALLASEKSIFIGTHGGELVCVSYLGEMKWKVYLGEKIGASPVVLQRDNNAFNCVINSGGRLCLVDCASSKIFCELQLGNQVFSSPVAIIDSAGIRILFGCRDNNLYSVYCSQR